MFKQSISKHFAKSVNQSLSILYFSQPSFVKKIFVEKFLESSAPICI